MMHKEAGRHPCLEIERCSCLLLGRRVPGGNHAEQGGHILLAEPELAADGADARQLPGRRPVDERPLADTEGDSHLVAAQQRPLAAVEVGGACDVAVDGRGSGSGRGRRVDQFSDLVAADRCQIRFREIRRATANSSRCSQ